MSFVITLWLEPSAEPEWRWRVTCVQTGEQRPVKGWERIPRDTVGQSPTERSCAYPTDRRPFCAENPK